MWSLGTVVLQRQYYREKTSLLLPELKIRLNRSLGMA